MICAPAGGEEGSGAGAVGGGACTNSTASCGAEADWTVTPRAVEAAAVLLVRAAILVTAAEATEASTVRIVATTCTEAAETAREMRPGAMER